MYKPHTLENLFEHSLELIFLGLVSCSAFLAVGPPSVLLAVRFAKGNKNTKIISFFAMLPMISFIIDIIKTWLGQSRGGFVSEIVFIFVFVASLIVLLKVVPQNLNAAIRARELEAEKMI